MKSKGSGIRDQGSNAMRHWLRAALPPMKADDGLARDLWPDMVRKLRAESAPAAVTVRIPWFDWALVAALAVLLLLFPAWIPVVLYYL